MNEEIKMEPKEEFQTPQIDPEIEKEALRTGWTPKDQFKGDPEKWRPANEWVERGREFIPFIKSENQQLKTQVSDLTSKLDQTNDMVQKMVKVQSKYSDDFYDTKISDIRIQKRKAAEEQDWDLYDKLEKQELTIEKPAPIESPDTSQNKNVSDNLDPGVAQWQRENNSWYLKDQELTEYADVIAERMAKSGHGFNDPYQFCEEVGRKVKKMFPDKFQNPNQGRTDFDESHLRGGDLPLSGNGEKTWNDLPAEAKRQCESLISQIPNYTKEKYVSDYFEGE